MDPWSSTVYHFVGVSSLFGVTILDSPHIVPENHLCPFYVLFFHHLFSIFQPLPLPAEDAEASFFELFSSVTANGFGGVQSCITTKGCITSREHMRGTSTLNWFARLDHLNSRKHVKESWRSYTQVSKKYPSTTTDEGR